MICIDEATLKEARMDSVPISLLEVLNSLDAVTARLLDKVPDWLSAELSNDGVAICRDRFGQWFLEPLSD
ncbi:hypothetical protein [Polaromonas sp. UBA4122]|uniref:hypothetical protein n=1 Tax=Polaromonas sp. UBA4122 TaxID=1947074 RepID=UPI0025F9A6BB|nr:hypothetical protein [Polaromonas sp. UBA4122]